MEQEFLDNRSFQLSYADGVRLRRDLNPQHIVYEVSRSFASASAILPVRTPPTGDYRRNITSVMARLNACREDMRSEN